MPKGSLVVAYLAGVIDSDGCIGIHRDTYTMRVRDDVTQVGYQTRITVKQVTPQAIDLLHETFGASRYTAKATARARRPLHVWYAHAGVCGPILEALLPYLRIKRLQAENALALCRINAEGHRRRFPLPSVVPGEPLVSMVEAAERLGKSYAVVLQSVRKNNVPSVRVPGRRGAMIPESYLATWASRGTTPTRNPEVTARMDACYLRAKELNSGAYVSG